ncbi:MAG: aromatic amino acid hydroxylase [Candidatus Zixiibacteriota bacterium]|nr:MAG: aromatic amino acid hydroxylase [candidate division Zixibacteria bacterium]
MENEIIKRLPKHLKQFIVDQNYKSYTPVDHSVWRYVLRQNHRFLREYAHKIYFEGLEKTGLKVESIPSIAEMNKILSRIGWAAVTVDGFIPPAAFMEFQSHRVLVIAADMRQIHHIEYTPSPDIVHEAAGHAPVIADPKYAEYLRRFGEIGTKAMSSKKDFELYEAIRRLSILKELPNADPQEIDKAHADVLYKQNNLGKPSEMALLSRLHWWTVEFGLIGPLDNPKIYGAGLLSSIGEAAHCFSDEVKKLPYGPDTVNYPFDITTMQPHLFVTPDFDHLIEVLERFAVTMAFNVGGGESIQKAIECERPSTCVFSSGLQLSGVFTEMLTDSAGEPAYVKTSGPSALAYKYRELPGHNKDYHSQGFGSPVGRLRGVNQALEELSDEQLDELQIVLGNFVHLEFESGVTVNGTLEKVIRRDGYICLMTFGECSVAYRGQVLFEPSWGTYDMAVGAGINSVFAGAADKDAYEQPSTVSKMRVVKVNYDNKMRRLHSLYQKVRDCREDRVTLEVLSDIWEELTADYPDDWLLSVEILEILESRDMNSELRLEIRRLLEKRVELEKPLSKLISDGLYLIDNPEAFGGPH